MKHNLRRALIALALASGALLILGGGAQANGDGGRAHAGAPGAAQPAATGCDVPGTVCDPSKSDHDNGVGNNCDPGFGRGNQTRFAPDEKTTTGCRTRPAPNNAEVAAAPAGTVLGQSQAAPKGGVLAETGTALAGMAPNGAVLAATGLPLAGAGVGLMLVVGGAAASARRRL